MGQLMSWPILLGSAPGNEKTAHRTRILWAVRYCTPVGAIALTFLRRGRQKLTFDDGASLAGMTSPLAPMSQPKQASRHLYVT